jgi:hypothetical protein
VFGEIVIETTVNDCIGFGSASFEGFDIVERAVVDLCSQGLDGLGGFLMMS